MTELDPFEQALHTAKVQVHRALRWARDQRRPVPPARHSRLLVGVPQVAEQREQLWNPDLDPRELSLELGKVENLRVAARALDGLEFEAGQMFSFWAQVGAPLRMRGFVAGRELREGCVVPGIGGGLCLLSNGLYRAAKRAGFEILERHAHSRRPPGSRAALGEDATVAWNYVDLRFVGMSPWRLEVRLDSESLIISVRGDRRRKGVPVLHERRAREGAEPDSSAGRPGWVGEGGRSCLSCDQPCGFAKSAPATKSVGRRSWLVDAAWPEYIELARRELGPRERLLQPIDGERLGQARYAWPLAHGAERLQFPVLTVARSLRARQLASQGPARQRAMLADDRRLAAAMAAALDPEDTSLVVSQTLLPHLWELGALGGRRVHVLMQRLPLLELQARLDEAGVHAPESPTLGDFRAAPALVEAETRALEDAVQIITPHAAIAGCFPAKARLLDWASPSLERRSDQPRSGPLRLYLPASAVGRKGVWELRAALRGLGPVELQVAGRELEGPEFWASLGPELRVAHGRLALESLAASLDAVVLPAWVEHEPRALLRALALGIPVIASKACGLGDRPGLESFGAGETRQLRAHLGNLRSTLAGSFADESAAQ